MGTNFDQVGLLGTVEVRRRDQLRFERECGPCGAVTAFFAWLHLLLLVSKGGLLYPVYGYLEILVVPLYADEIPVQVYAGDTRSAASHREIKDRFALVGICLYEVFHQSDGLLGGVDASIVWVCVFKHACRVVCSILCEPL